MCRFVWWRSHYSPEMKRACPGNEKMLLHSPSPRGKVKWALFLLHTHLPQFILWNTELCAPATGTTCWWTLTHKLIKPISLKKSLFISVRSIDPSTGGYTVKTRGLNAASSRHCLFIRNERNEDRSVWVYSSRWVSHTWGIFQLYNGFIVSVQHYGSLNETRKWL